MAQTGAGYAGPRFVDVPASNPPLPPSGTAPKPSAAGSSSAGRVAGPGEVWRWLVECGIWIQILFTDLGGSTELESVLGPAPTNRGRTLFDPARGDHRLLVATEGCRQYPEASADAWPGRGSVDGNWWTQSSSSRQAPRRYPPLRFRRRLGPAIELSETPTPRC